MYFSPKHYPQQRFHWLTSENTEAVRALISQNPRKKWQIVQTILHGNQYSEGIKACAAAELMEPLTLDEFMEITIVDNTFDRDVVTFENLSEDFLYFIVKTITLGKKNAGSPLSTENANVPFMHDFYNRCLFLIMELCTNEEIFRLTYEQFCMKDRYSFVTIGQCSGYNPLVRLLWSNNIPLAIKQDAIKKMQHELLKESGLLGNTRGVPYEAHEFASIWVLKIAQLYATSNTHPYPRLMFLDQIEAFASLKVSRPLDRRQNLLENLRRILQALYFQEGYQDETLQAKIMGILLTLESRLKVHLVAAS